MVGWRGLHTLLLLIGCAGGVVCAAEPAGGWRKFDGNPVMGGEHGTCFDISVMRDGDWHLMFYIGYQDEPSAKICLARSRDGITDWQRHPANPIIFPGTDKRDHDACCKPYAIFDGSRWLLWHNGRHGSLEQIGVALHPGGDLGFDE